MIRSSGFLPLWSQCTIVLTEISPLNMIWTPFCWSYFHPLCTRVLFPSEQSSCPPGTKQGSGLYLAPVQDFTALVLPNTIPSNDCKRHSQVFKFRIPFIKGHWEPISCDEHDFDNIMSHQSTQQYPSVTTGNYLIPIHNLSLFCTVKTSFVLTQQSYLLLWFSQGHFYFITSYGLSERKHHREEQGEKEWLIVMPLLKGSVCPKL